MVREQGDTYEAGWGGPWLRDSLVRFKHVVTGQYLFRSARINRAHWRRVGCVHGCVSSWELSRRRGRTLAQQPFHNSRLLTPPSPSGVTILNSIALTPPCPNCVLKLLTPSRCRWVCAAIGSNSRTARSTA